MERRTAGPQGPLTIQCLPRPTVELIIHKTTSRAKSNNKIADRLAAPNSAPVCDRRAATSGAVRRQLAHTRRVAALSLLVTSCTICTATQYRPRHSFLPETDA